MERELQSLSIELANLTLEHNETRKRLILVEGRVKDIVERLQEAPTTESKFGFIIGEKIIVSSRSRQRGKKGVIVGFTSEKIQVSFPFLKRITTYLPKSLSRTTSKEQNDGKSRKLNKRPRVEDEDEEEEEDEEEDEVAEGHSQVTTDKVGVVSPTFSRAVSRG